LNDLLAGYLQFRQKVEEAGKGGGDGKLKKPPQLIVVGHGSIDDPDGSRIYEELHQASTESGCPADITITYHRELRRRS